MSAAASTSGGKASRRFWSSRLRDVYESCALPTETDCAASHSISSNGFSKETAQKSSWMQTTLTPLSESSPTTCSRSSRSLAHAFTGPAPSAEGSASAPKKAKTVQGPKQFEVTRPLTEGQQLRTLSVRLYPTSAQARELRRCFKAARWSYNAVVAAVRNEGVRPNSAPLWKKLMEEAPPDLKAVHSKIRKRAIKQAAEAFLTNERKRAKNPKHKYTIGFRSYKKTRTEVILLEKAYLDKEKPDTGPVKKILLAPSPLRRGGKRCDAHVFFGKTMKACGPVRASDRTEVIERLAADKCLLEDGQLLWDKTVGTFHMLVRFRRDALPDPDPEGRHKTVVALDPGCRAFNTYYDPTGRHGELLFDAERGINERCKQIDTLCAKMAKLYKDRGRTKRVRQRRRRTIRRALAHRRNSLRNWMKNAHYDASNFLLDRYDVVLAPTFAVKDMAKRNGRVFGKKTARSMYNWSHYAFRQRLKSKAFSYSGRLVVEIGEPGTSKTCGCCGWWNADLGGNKKYICKKCEATMDRDVNGARNNLLAAYGVATGVLWDGTE